MTIVAAQHHVLVGTAGHIDHGKTRLIASLTGVDTDRLPEEKTRGISIDLGFAHWRSGEYHFGVVDVPGHERFVKNMVAGATGVDVALLVVAADDGVMPQTREHLEIMDLLGVKTGVVAITKIDLVEPELVLLVEEEVGELVHGTFLQSAAVVPVSSETGEGTARLKSALEEAARGYDWPETDRLFRMPVDRVFSLRGHGTIATGSVLSGEVHPGDELDLLPARRTLRVRRVQTHGLEATDSSARQRTALNLAGVKPDEIERGDELATPGFLRPTRRVIVGLKNLESSPLTLKDRLELQLHVGTCEVRARVILKGKRLGPGQQGYAELRTNKPIVAAFGQRFILRRISPPVTVAGGKTIDPYVAARKRVKHLEEYGKRMDTPDEAERLSFLLSQQDRVEDSPIQAAWRAGIATDRYTVLIDQLKMDGTLVPLREPTNPLLVHRERFETLRRAVMRTITTEVMRRQLRRSLPRNTLATACREIASAEIVDAILADLLAKGALVAIGENLGPAELRLQLTRNQRQLLDRLSRAVRDAGLTPPTVKELADKVDQQPGDVEPLLDLLQEDGLLIRVADGMYFSPAALEQARATLSQQLADGGEATLSELRSAWNTSRKYAVPLAEYFDKRGVTVRVGDLRRAGPKLSVKIASGGDDAR